eukprot:4556259-Amphidinium_carterae.1
MIRSSTPATPRTPPPQHNPNASQELRDHLTRLSDDLRRVSAAIGEMPAIIERLCEGGGKQNLQQQKAIKKIAIERVNLHMPEILSSDQLNAVCDNTTTAAALVNANSTVQLLVCALSALRRLHLHKEADDVLAILHAQPDFDASKLPAKHLSKPPHKPSSSNTNTNNPKPHSRPQSRPPLPRRRPIGAAPAPPTSTEQEPDTHD